MHNPVMDRLQRRKKANRTDKWQRLAMGVFIASVAVVGVIELVKGALT